MAVVVVMLPCYTQAMDSGQYENVDPNVRSWFKSVRSPHGVPCCDIADGHRTDWEQRSDNHYWVPIEGEWRQVPPESVVYNAGNPTGKPSSGTSGKGRMASTSAASCREEESE